MPTFEELRRSKYGDSTPQPEEEKTSEEYIELGIYNEKTYSDFVAVQFNLIDNPREPL